MRLTRFDNDLYSEDRMRMYEKAIKKKRENERKTVQ